jgi:hypothetical protein
MKSKQNFCSVLAVGFILFFFWSVALYWLNRTCDEVVSAFLPRNINVQEPEELKVEMPGPGYYRPGSLNCSLPDLNESGLEQSMQRLLAAPEEQTYMEFRENRSCWIAFVYDNTLRQILVRRTESVNRQISQKTLGYIGPKGYSDTKNPGLGAFGTLLSMTPYFNHNKPLSAFHFFLYEPSGQRFYRIDMNVHQILDKGSVFYTLAADSIKITEGPVINQPDWQPAEIKQILSGKMYITYIPAAQRIRKFHPFAADQYPGVDPQTMPDSGDTYIDNITIPNAPRVRWPEKDLLVLHSSGRIDYVAGNTLSVVRTAGYLPKVGFYTHSKSRNLHDLGGYGITALMEPNDVYRGIAVAAASRDGLTMQMDFYDDKGNACEIKSLKLYHFYNCSLYTLTNYPAGPVYLLSRYLAENLQSPLLRLLDMPAAKWVQAQNRQNTIFVQPNSLIGLMKFESDRFGFWLQFLLLMLPSLIISIWLGILARKRAALLGYSELSKDGWFIAILALGIPAYITFRLTLPKQRMVTCANCGNLRRVEFETCQSCKRDWQKTKSLTTAPDWSVRDTAKTDTDTPVKSEMS